VTPPSLTNLATSRVVGERPRSNSSGKVAMLLIISLFVRQSSLRRMIYYARGGLP
jgi:hypothetical protein